MYKRQPYEISKEFRKLRKGGATLYISATPPYIYLLPVSYTHLDVYKRQEPYLIPTMLLDTISSVLYPKDSVAAAFIAAFTSSTVTVPSTTAVKIVRCV